MTVGFFKIAEYATIPPQLLHLLSIVASWQTSNHLLEVSVFVFAVGLQDNGDDGHERFDHTELQSGLLTEPQEADGVGFSPQTAGTVHTAGPEGTNTEFTLTGAVNIMSRICGEFTVQENRRNLRLTRWVSLGSLP